MDVLSGVWIKAFSYLFFALLLVILGVVALKKLHWKNHEIIIIFLISLVLSVFGLINSTYAINPKIERIDVQYVYQNSKGVLLGREYHFVDKNGNNYDLVMDPITERKIFRNGFFEKDIEYHISYEIRSNTITSIIVADNDSNNTGQ